MIGIAAALASSAAWAMGAVLFRGLGRELSPLPMTLGKSAIGTLLLAIALLITGGFEFKSDQVVLLCLSGLIGISVGDACFFAALRELPAHVVVALMLLCPVITIVLAVIIFGERPSAGCWLGIALCLGGVGAITVSDLRGGSEPDAPSLVVRKRAFVAGIAAVVCTAVATLIVKDALVEVPALPAAFMRMAAGVAGLGVYGLLSRKTLLWARELRQFKVGARMLIATTIVTFGGFWLGIVSLRYADITVANTLNSLEPLFILPLGAIFLGEKPRWPAVAGALVACGGAGIIVAVGGK